MSDKNGKWYDAAWFKGMVMVVVSSVVTTLGIGGKDMVVPSKGGNLDKFINGPFEGYKVWVNNELDKKDLLITELRQRILSLEKGEPEDNDQWADEVHGTVIYKRNMVSGKLYYDATDGNRYPVKHNQSDGYNFKYGFENGKALFWKCEYDASHPMVIFNNVDQGIFNW